MATLARVTYGWNWTGSKRVSVGWDFQSLVALDDTNLSQLANAAHAFWLGNTNAIRTLTPASLVGSEARAFGYEVQAEPTPPPAGRKVLVLGPVVVPSSAPGLAVADSMPPNVAVVQTFRTAVSTRRTRGRIYYPSVPEDKSGPAGGLDDTWRASLNTALEQWVVSMEASAVAPQTFTHSVVSTATAAGRVTRVTVYQMGDRVDTQRRRLSRLLDVF